MAPFIILLLIAWVIHVVERRTALREVERSSPRPDQHLGLEITEENVLPFSTQTVRDSSLLGQGR